MPILENNSSKSGKFGAFFFTKILCRILFLFFCQVKMLFESKEIDQHMPSIQKKSQKGFA